MKDLTTKMSMDNFNLLSEADEMVERKEFTGSFWNYVKNNPFTGCMGIRK